MSHRYFAALATAVAIVALTPLAAAAQAENAADTPRTPWGVPDLQGVWDFRSITPMERPAALADQEFLTAEEAARLEQETLDRNEELLNRAAVRTTVTESVDSGENGAPGFYNNFWLDRGTTTVGTRRTSLVIDPPNGRMPPFTPEAEARHAALRAAREGVVTHAPTPGGWMEDFGSNGLQLRCITGFNSGPPMTPGGYNNNVQIFQTPDTVALLVEMNHNVRVVPLDGRPHTDLPQWTGEARGYWEGDTLVVETSRFLRETSFSQGRTDANLRLTERFTRVADDTLLYQATIDDPTVWTRPWTYEVPMQRNEEPLFEYACHEGNYGLYNILAGARAEEAEAEAAAQSR
ncbi:MAG: hypothetical protein F4X11_01360 [Acidobacteria bacterium]|nr:hypothetical protein [Acidobacteriota bacterium]